jgi:hypothetical protein
VQFSSLNQAADYLGITQSAITRRLQRLEQDQQAVELFRLALNAQALLVHPLTGGGQGQRAGLTRSAGHSAVFFPQSGGGLSGDHPVGDHPAPAASGAERQYRRCA